MQFTKPCSTKMQRFLVFAVLLMTFLCSSACLAKGKLVRVGYYESPFNQTSAAGVVSGYAYDYQQDIKSYTGWDYEYVKAEWPTLLQMLKRGEIDLLSDVSLTPERKNEMLFSAKPMGAEKYYLYVSYKNKEITPANYRGLNGKRVGVNAGSVQADMLRKWQQDNNFQMHIVECNGDRAMHEMLTQNELDAVVGVDSYRYEGSIPIVKIGESAFYFAINKQRHDLKEELDAAMSKVLDGERYYNELMYKDYLDTKANVLLGHDEITWLQQHTKIKVGYVDKLLGYCAKDESSGELIGSLALFLKEANNVFVNHELNFTPVAFANLDDGLKALQRGEIDCMFPVLTSRYHAEKRGYLLTSTLYNSTAVVLVKDKLFSEKWQNTVALVGDKLDRRIYLEKYYPHWRIKDYASNEECIEAVRRGEVDCALFNSFAINHDLIIGEQMDLQAVRLVGEMDYSLAVGSKNKELYSILNRAIGLVSKAELNSSLSYYSSSLSKKQSFMDFVRQHMLLVLVLSAVLLAVLLILLQRAIGAERRALEALQEAERANMAKTNFLNSMSHDIRTPMNAIVGFTALAGEHLEDKRQLENYLKKISVSSKHLLSLINDVLDMSRIESGRINIVEQECHLPTLLQEWENILQADASSKHLKVRFTTENIKNNCFRGDKLRLSQVVLNCLSNAVKFTKPGGSIDLQVRQRDAEAARCVYEFKISDTGIGMSEEFQKHVFEPFSREETSTISGIPGTGLGMAITKNIVDLMGGSISVKSVQGRGSTFTIALPFACCEQSVPASTKEAVTSAERTAVKKTDQSTDERELADTFPNKRVLLVEDNDLNREIARAMLSSFAVAVEEAENGKVALEMVATAAPGYYDLVLMDIQMPVMNGYEAARAILDLPRDDTKQLPIIAVSANAFKEDCEKSQAAGMVEHMSKPFTKQMLKDLLNKYLQG